MKQQIIEKVTTAMTVLVTHGIWTVNGTLPEVIVERPKNSAHGDWTTNVAFLLAKKLKKSPQKVAEELVETLHAQDETLSVTAIGGYVNVTLAHSVVEQALVDIVQDGVTYGTSQMGTGRIVIVEYSSPNIAKPFTIGHFRSTVIGDALANIMVASGFTVIRDNHLGDWGTQFGKLSLAIKKWGNEDVIAVSENPVKVLVALYVQFHDETKKDPTLDDAAREWFARLENGDFEAVDLWKKCITWSMIEFDRIYKRLGVSFTTTLGESFFQDKMDVVLDDLRAKNLLTESEGAQLVFFEGDVLPPAMMIKSDGTTLYATRDLATDRYRKEKYNPDIIINETGSEQNLYFKQLFAIEEILGYYVPGQRVHISHGLFRFRDGKMSTRKGNVIWLDEVLDRSVVEAKKMGASGDIAEVVGIGALKFNDLKREASRSIDFDWEEILNIKGDSGPYLQYTYARCQSVLAKARDNDIKMSVVQPCQNVIELERILMQFGEVIERAAIEYAPHHIAQYMIELARLFNSFYAENKIVDIDNIEQSAYRVLVTQAVAQVMKNGLGLLGISTPEKM